MSGMHYLRLLVTIAALVGCRHHHLASNVDASAGDVDGAVDAGVDAPPLPICACYYGAGKYCGTGVQTQAQGMGCTVPGLDQNLGNVYACSGTKTSPGTWTVAQQCSNGCNVAPAGVDDSCVNPNAYYLPWQGGATHNCTQGNNQGSHTGLGAYAWDFGVNVDTPVWAARGGTVRLTQFLGSGDACFNGVNLACTNCISAADGHTDCTNRGNYVVIDHGDGTQALYLHLWEVDVTVGQTIHIGQVIAKSGNSGCSCGAHLHYMVEHAGPSYYEQSIASSFVEGGVPQTGQPLTSANP
jgi:hypothetical protein